jgi:hypothetical protein
MLVPREPVPTIASFSFSPVCREAEAAGAAASPDAGLMRALPARTPDVARKLRLDMDWFTFMIRCFFLSYIMFAVIKNALFNDERH